MEDCWFCRLKRWWHQLFMKYYCSRCDVVSPPTSYKMIYGGSYVGMVKTTICTLCGCHDELHICYNERIEQIRQNKSNQERHRKEQEEFRRLKHERRAMNREKQARERAAKNKEKS